MKRVALMVLVVASGLAWIAAADEQAASYRLDAIFDNASQVVKGQDVKIAGAPVGYVEAVELTEDHRARLKLRIDKRFAPFRTDAACTIQPQSIIGEKFVQCTPGSPDGRALKGDPAVLGHERNRTPVDLDLVFGALRLPYRERLRLVVNELGAGIAARGDDLNAAIRKANPALDEANQVLGILDRDRAQLGSLIDDTDAILAALTPRRRQVADAIDRGSVVTRTTAENRDELDATVAKLPATLREARPAFAALRRLGEAGEPILADLEAAAPSVQRLVGDLPPLSDAARPALKRLGTMAVTGRDALDAAAPLVKQLRTFAAAAKPTGRLVDALFASMRERGVVEGLQSFVYYAAAATSRFDTTSHIVPAHLQLGECSQYATAPVPSCDAHFVTPGAATKATRSRRKKARPRTRTRSRREAPDSPRRPRPTPAPAAPAPATPTPAPSPTPATPPVDALLDFLFGS